MSAEGFVRRGVPTTDTALESWGSAYVLWAARRQERVPDGPARRASVVTLVLDRDEVQELLYSRVLHPSLQHDLETMLEALT